MSKSEKYMELEKKYGARNYKPLPVVLSRSEGVWVWDVDGKKYLDCLASYSAVNQGHRHPHILKAMEEQTKKLTLTSRAFYNDMLGPFLKKLCQTSGMEAALPMNTGAEAVETGIKIARKWGYKRKGVEEDSAEIIVCDQNFHGRTTTIVGFSSNMRSREGFGPFTPGFVSIPYDDPEALENAITKNTVAFLVEPIQGEGGVIIPRRGYLKRVRKICDKHNVLLMLDEIQTGLARTGKMFCYQHEGIKPDIMLLGKALGGGVYPVSAALTRWDVMDVIKPGEHGSTFGGNPLACAVGIASLEVLEKEELGRRSEKLGKYFLDGLKKIAKDNPLISEVRGKGLFLAIELNIGVGDARKYCLMLKEKGMLAKDTHHVVIRFAPPLVIKKEEIDWGLGVIGEVFEPA